MIIIDPTDKHGADFNLRNPAKRFRIDQGILPAVLCKDRKLSKRYGTDRMQLTLDKGIFSLTSRFRVDIAMIMIHTEPIHKTGSTVELFCQFFIPEEIRDQKMTLLHRKNRVLFCFPDRQKRFTGPSIR